METGASKEQIIKVIILAGILVLVLVFKEPIRKGIFSLRNRSKSAASVSPPREKAALPFLKSDENVMNENLTDEKLMEELAEASRQRAAISPGEREEWPECIKRDIFAFPKAPAPAPVSKAPARGSGSKSGSGSKKEGKAESQTDFKLEGTVTGDIDAIKDQFHLKATIIREDYPVALINDEFFTVGDRILGCKVREIRKGKVILSTRDGQEIPLTMK